MFGLTQRLTIDIETWRNEAIAKCHRVKLRPIWLPSCKTTFDSKKKKKEIHDTEEERSGDKISRTDLQKVVLKSIKLFECKKMNEIR